MAFRRKKNGTVVPNAADGVATWRGHPQRLMKSSGQLLCHPKCLKIRHGNVCRRRAPTIAKYSYNASAGLEDPATISRMVHCLAACDRKMMRGVMIALAAYLMREEGGTSRIVEE